MGLDYLHRFCGIIHTDLKPENVLVTGQPLPPPLPHGQQNVTSKMNVVSAAPSIGTYDHDNNDNGDEQLSTIYSTSKSPPQPKGSTTNRTHHFSFTLPRYIRYVSDLDPSIWAALDPREKKKLRTKCRFASLFEICCIHAVNRLYSCSQPIVIRPVVV